MSKIYQLSFLGFFVLLCVSQIFSAQNPTQKYSYIQESPKEKTMESAQNLKTIYLAGGCFWGLEAYMKKIGDSELPSQKIEHGDFTEKMHEISVEGLDEDAIRNKMTDLLEYLSRWLFQHIIGSDSLIGKFESQYVFTSKFHVGVELIDKEHARLFEIIGEANRVIHAEYLHDKYDEIVKILEELRDYTEVHFRDEEELMTKVNYPDLPAQKRAHASFEEKLAEINLEEVDDNQQEYLEELVEYLRNWLVNHILRVDKLIPAE